MPKSKVSFETVREIARQFPDVEETTTWGAPTLKVRGQLLACVPTNRSAEPDSLVLRIDFPDRAALLEENPAAFYLPDHYAGYTSVLVRPSQVDKAALRDLLGVAYKFVTRLKPSTSRPRKRR